MRGSFDRTPIVSQELAKIEIPDLSSGPRRMATPPEQKQQNCVRTPYGWFVC